MKEDKEKIQQKVFEYQLLQQHFETLQQQLQILVQQNHELLKLKDSLLDLEKTKTEKETFSQIGSGIYVKSILKENKQVLFNVGSNILVEKKTEDAISSLENQSSEIKNSISEIEEQSNKVVTRIIELQEELQKLKTSS